MSELYCVHHGPISRHACMAFVEGPLLCSYCGTESPTEVKTVTPFATDPLRRMLERHLSALGYENAASDRTGVTEWLAPDAGYEDGIAPLTTLEAIAQALDRGDGVAR